VAEEIRSAVLTFTRLESPSRVLELGAGTGRVALPFILAGDRFIGIDVSQAMLARLQEKAASAGRHCELIAADITEPLPFVGEAFDLILGVHVFHLIERWQPALREARRVLRKPGGWLLIAGDERPAYPTGCPQRMQKRAPGLSSAPHSVQ